MSPVLKPAGWLTEEKNYMGLCRADHSRSSDLVLYFSISAYFSRAQQDVCAYNI